MMRLGLQRPCFSCVKGSFGKVWEHPGSMTRLCPIPNPAVFCNTQAEGPGTVLTFPSADTLWEYCFGFCSLFSSLRCSELLLKGHTAGSHSRAPG